MQGKRDKKINSRQKGASGEREFARKLREAGYKAERGCQHSGGKDSPDVKTNMTDVHFEVKRTEKLRLYDAMEQAKRDAKKEKMSVVAHRKNREEWVIIMTLDDWLQLYNAAHEGEEKEEENGL